MFNLTTRALVRASALAVLVVAIAIAASSSPLVRAADNTVVVFKDTAAAENQPGWMFNRDASTDTPFAFDTEQASIGSGSLHVLPIGATAADKFIGELFLLAPLDGVEEISYDFRIGGAGDDFDEEQFYMNVYVNFASSAPDKFYDCRYDVIPSTGSASGFTTVSFDPNQAYPVTTRVSSPVQPCPPVPSAMGAGAILRAVALNVGDTSASDVGIGGYLDKVAVTISGDTTTYDFEPQPLCSTVCYVDAAAGNDANGGTSIADAKKTIQAGIDAVAAGGEVRVLPGAYSETAPGSATTALGGVYQFGLFFPAAKPGITLRGVTAADANITDAALTQATITTNATNNFGASGVFVEAEDTTIIGLTFGDNIPGNNKTIEVVANNFRIEDSRTQVTDGGAIYISDFKAPLIDPVDSYAIVDNLFDDGTQIAISSGAGETGPVGGRVITGNTFSMGGANWPGISFNGKSDTTGGPGWFSYPVGGAVITGNSFSGSTQYIRARGLYHEGQFDWESFWDDNTYDKGVVALVTETPFDVRSWSYTSAPYTFVNVRRIGAVIQPEVDNAVAGDTVLVKAGTYPENVIVGKTLTLKGANAGVAGDALRGPESIVDGTDTSSPFQVTANNVVLNGFKVVNGSNGLGAGIHTSPANSGTTIVNSVISANTIGIYANCLSNCLIADNLFDSNNKPGSAGGSAIYSEFTNGLTVRDNEVRGHTTNSPVIFAATSGSAHTNLVLRGNHLHDNLSGVYALSVDGGLFEYNDISAADGTAITFDGGSDGVVVRYNNLHDSARGVRVRDLGYGFGANSGIVVNRNAITGNTDQGILVGALGHTGIMDAQCTWYGSATGPSGAGPGSGDSVTTGLDFLPWLSVASPLETAPCLGGADAIVHVSGRIEPKGKPSLTLSGNLTVVDGTVLGSLSVNYKTLNRTCVFTGDGNSSYTLIDGVLTMSNLTNSCAAGEFTVVLTSNTVLPKRGAISIDGPATTYDVPQSSLTNGNVEF